MSDFIIIENWIDRHELIFFVDTLEEIAAAKVELRARGVEQAPVYRGGSEDEILNGECDVVKTSLILVA